MKGILCLVYKNYRSVAMGGGCASYGSASAVYWMVHYHLLNGYI